MKHLQAILPWFVAGFAAGALGRWWAGDAGWVLATLLIAGITLAWPDRS